MSLSIADQLARSRFQSGLLAWLRAADDPSGLREMIAVVRGQALDDSANALLWRSAEAFLQAMLDGTLPADNAAKQLCRRLERRLGRGGVADSEAPPGDPAELCAALFAFVSNTAPQPAVPHASALSVASHAASPLAAALFAASPLAPSQSARTLAEPHLVPPSATSPAAGAAPCGGAPALEATLAATADLLPLLELNRKPPRRCDDEQLARWRQAAARLDASWHRLQTGEATDCRDAATQLVAVALELSDAASLCLAEALADAVGLAENPALAERPAFRAAVAAALEIAGEADGPDQKVFDDKVERVARRLADNRQTQNTSVLPGGPKHWFAEDAREWLHELHAAIDAVPPKRLALLAGIEWLAQQDACSMMAIRGLATLANKVIRQVRADDLDEPATHELLRQTLAALERAVDELAAGQPPRPDEDTFAALRRFDARLLAQRQQLSAQKHSQ